MNIITAGFSPEQSASLADHVGDLEREQVVESHPASESEDMTPRKLARVMKRTGRRARAARGLLSGLDSGYGLLPRVRL